VVSSPNKESDDGKRFAVVKHCGAKQTYEVYTRCLCVLS
jgi:hypothetical protein